MRRSRARHSRRHLAASQPRALVLNDGNAVMLRGEAGVALSVAQQFTVIEGPSGWHAQVSAYFYVLADPGGQELLAFHWHPVGASPIRTPHDPLRLRAAARAAERSRLAGQVRLHEHPDFAAFVTAAAAERDLAEPFVEKDYWITEILRVIATTLPDRAIFKGSTSLSKGWALLDRFSEDIDLFVDPVVDPPLAKRALDRTLKTLSKDVVAIGGLELAESATIGGFGRIDTFGYSSLFSGIAGFPPTVRLEPGVQSGKQPTEDVEISSFVADLLRARGATKELDDVDGLEPFTMTLLALPQNVRREALRAPRQGRATQGRRPSTRRGATPKAWSPRTGWPGACATATGNSSYPLGTLTAPKSGLTRTVPMAEQVRDLLKAHRKLVPK